MKSKRRRRYKKKKHDLLLYSKIALICYLSIFGISYMSSDTSAYFTNQSEFSQIITVGKWEVPDVLVDGCGKEYTIDEVSNEETNDVLEDKDDNAIEESEKDVIPSGEKEMDCGDKEGASMEIDEKDPAGEVECKAKDDSLVEENENEAAPSNEVKVDCENKDDKSNEEIEKDKVPEDVEIIEPIIEEQKENEENEEKEEEEENEGKVNVDDPQKSNDGSQIEADIKDESVPESNDENLTEEDSTKEASENSEMIDTVK